MTKALDFLDLQKQALEARSREALGFVAVNQTLKLLPYKHAIFWSLEGTDPHPECISGNATIDHKGPYGLWLKGVLKQHQSASDNPLYLKRKDILDNDTSKEWCAEHILILYLRDIDGAVIGGLWLERDKAFKDVELALLGELASALETKLSLFMNNNGGGFKQSWRQLKRHQKFIWIALVLLALCPVRLNVTAPAEIIAKEKMVASAPYSGIVNDVLVEPGESVTHGQVLATMDSEELLAQADSAARALETAKSSLARLKREVLSAPEKKAELNLLQAEIDAKEIEYEYASTMLERSAIRSPRDGIAILSDANQYLNKPVAAGESLIEIASPKDMEVLIRVPVDALIPFSEDADVKLYLNTSPLSAIQGEIKTIGYQASPDPDGLLTYKVRASALNGEGDLRIGRKGTAKIYGARTILAYSILRRPLIALRRLGG